MKQKSFIISASLVLCAVILPSITSAYFTKNLSLGNSGDEVRALQVFLANNKNIYPEGLVSGFFGKKTQEAVMRFQKENGLSQVGNVGPKTREILNGLFIDSTASNNTNNAYVPMINEVNSSASANSGYIFWTTNKNTKSTLFYSTASPVNYISSTKIDDNNFSFSHSANIPNLASGTTYYYLVKIFDSKNNSATSTELSFTTLTK